MVSLKDNRIKPNDVLNVEMGRSGLASILIEMKARRTRKWQRLD